jgi:integrase
MPRVATLRKKNGYWYTAAGGQSGTYFGRVDDVSHADAKAAFAKHLTEITGSTPKGGPTAVAVLFDAFLTALKASRSSRNYIERKLHLNRFANHRRKNVLLGDMNALTVKADDLTDFLGTVQHRFELDELTTHKHFISVVAAFNWGAGAARLKNPNPMLPTGFRPFTQIERYTPPPNELHEDELPTLAEIKALLKHADTDIELIRENHRYRSRLPGERRNGRDNPYIGFADLLRVYHATGARTSELANCDVRDFLPSAKQIVMGKHKRSKTLREAASRRITLNTESLSIVKRCCQGKEPTDPIFADPHGNRWTSSSLDIRLKRVRKMAGVRDEITIYSFRHLWISQALMAGVDIATVAKMAGTSVAMIEKVYGHFSADHMTEAQNRDIPKSCGWPRQFKRRVWFHP